mgnify:CR=1 FL=1
MMFSGLNATIKGDRPVLVAKALTQRAGAIRAVNHARVNLAAEISNQIRIPKTACASQRSGQGGGIRMMTSAEASQT